MEARVYLDHHVSQEEHRIQLTKIVCTLLRSTLLCKQWFGSDSFLPVASQGGRDASQLSGEEGEEEGKEGEKKRKEDGDGAEAAPSTTLAGNHDVHSHLLDLTPRFVKCGPAEATPSSLSALGHSIS